MPYQNEIISELAHEINSPLKTIRGSSEFIGHLLKEDAPKELMVEQLKTINSMVDRIDEMVSSLNNFSSGTGSHPVAVWTLRDIINDVRFLASQAAKLKGISFDLDLEDPVLETTVHCSRPQVSEILFGFLMKTISTVADMEGPWIKIEILKERERAIIRIKDSGPEIPESSIARTVLQSQGGDLLRNHNCGVSCSDFVLPR